LLQRTFAYRRFHTYPTGRTAWMSAAEGEADAPAFGGAWQVYNVIDSRQSYLQNIVAAGVRALGYAEQADRSVHFSYEMVALTPRCARELGIQLTPEDEKRPFVEVSGRKGQGVKADDLLDALEALHEAKWRRGTPTCPRSSRLGWRIRSPWRRCGSSCCASRATRPSRSTSRTRSTSTAKPALPAILRRGTQHLPQAARSRARLQAGRFARPRQR
jgi:hypothetical protein